MRKETPTMASWRAVVLAACAGGTLACRGILDVTGYGLIRPEGDAAPQTYTESCSGVEYVSESCPGCIQRNCCDLAEECAGDPACRALSQCLASCEADDRPCRTICNLSIRRTSAASRFMACAASCETCAASRATFGGDGCTACLESSDPEGMQAFSKSVTALELESCQVDCPPAYQSHCACTDYAAEGPLLASLRESPSCNDTCQEADWSCLDSVKAPPLGSAERELDLHVQVAPIEATGSPLTGALVTACSWVDPDCANPLVPPAPLEAATGFAELRLTRDGQYPFFGHLRVQWDEPTMEPVPPRQNHALLYFFPPLRRTPSWTFRRLVSTAIAGGNAGALGVTLDWERYGGIIFSVVACNLLPAADVTVTVDSLDAPDSQQRVYYFSGAFLDPGLERTAAVGLGAVVNATEGRKEVRVELAGGRPVGTYTILVVRGAITTLALSPVPLGGAP